MCIEHGSSLARIAKLAERQNGRTNPFGEMRAISRKRAFALRMIAFASAALAVFHRADWQNEPRKSSDFSPCLF
jgi:hypothetical protein